MGGNGACVGGADGWGGTGGLSDPTLVCARLVPGGGDGGTGVGDPCRACGEGGHGDVVGWTDGRDLVGPCVEEGLGRGAEGGVVGQYCWDGRPDLSPPINSLPNST